MNRSAEDCLEKAGIKAEQLRWVIPHQANFSGSSMPWRSVSAFRWNTSL
jgi:3-oxoacyl-[acyl-carrier-protein] synthase III